MSRVERQYFERIYAKGPDPWGFDSRYYERRKYALTVAALPKERYRRAFEPGCANGALTALLAPRCDSLIAMELMPECAARARARVPNVDIRIGAIPDDWPEGKFDLIVWSEVVYYLDDGGVTQLLARANESLERGGHVVAVHWTGKTDYPLTARAVHERFDAHAEWRRIVFHEDEEFLLAVYEKRE